MSRTEASAALSASAAPLHTEGAVSNRKFRAAGYWFPIAVDCFPIAQPHGGRCSAEGRPLAGSRSWNSIRLAAGGSPPGFRRVSAPHVHRSIRCPRYRRLCRRGCTRRTRRWRRDRRASTAVRLWTCSSFDEGGRTWSKPTGRAHVKVVVEFVSKPAHMLGYLGTACRYRPAARRRGDRRCRGRCARCRGQYVVFVGPQRRMGYRRQRR